MRGYRAGRSLLAAISVLVPSSRREEWLAEWSAELWELLRRESRSSGRGGVAIAAAGYLAGAPWSALWELKEEWMGDIWQDVRYGARSLARAPGFLLVAVVTLALGIGANTTVFSLVNGLLLREPGGIAAPSELVRIGRKEAPAFDNWSYPVFLDFRERAEWFSGVAGFASAGSLIVGTGQDAEAVPGQLVSHDYFDVLGVRLHLGRDFDAEETAAAGAGPVAVISHSLWQRRFGGSPDALGATLLVNGRGFQVVGVAPAGFGGSDILRAPADLWLPASMIETAYGPGASSMLGRRQSSWFWVFARLAPGVSHETATAATTALYARFDEEYPDLAGQGIQVARGIGMTPDDRAEAVTLSRILLGVVVLVLIIACANLAGLALARGAGRRGEMGVRTALGASRTRLVRQLFTESMMVALAGGAAAVGLTWLAAGKLHVVFPYQLSVSLEPDRTVLLFALLAALFAAILFGLLPALRTSRSDVRGVLAGSSRSVAGRGGRLRTALVALQLALSFVLLAGTGILLRSLHAARNVDPGFDADHVAVLDLDAGMRSGYDEDAARAFYQRLRDEAAAMPGVQAVGLVAELPIADFQSNHTPYRPGEVPGQRPEGTPPPPPVLSNTADAGYFDAVGPTLLAGRTFTTADYGEDAEQVAVIDRTLAERFFDGLDPVGRTLPFQADPDWERPTRVVGVVSALRNRSLSGDPLAQYWIPFERNYRGDMTLVARTPGDPAALAPRLAALVERLDPGMPVLRTATLRDLVGGTLGETRLVSTLIAIFGLIALALAAIGLYGVMAHSVAQRRRELGIRVAIGATARDIGRMVLGQGLRVAALGLAAGLLLALAGLRLLQGMLFDTAPADPLALTAAGLVLLLVTLAAALLPARSAIRVEPRTALEEE